MGQIPFHVCKKHYKETSPFHDYRASAVTEMGLVDNKTSKPVELKYWGRTTLKTRFKI